MKKTLKTKILEKILRWMAIGVLKKYKPKVVAITGSVGKTTTKEMVAQVLGTQYKIGKTRKNYNNEIGVPLTILGIVSDESSMFKWLGILFVWARAIFTKIDYPEILVLEMGADKPGDIRYFCDFVSIDVGILTNVGISHLENFKTKKEVANEKGYLLRTVPVGGLAVCNFDDEECKKIGIRLQNKTNVASYGFEKGADIQASDMHFNYEDFKPHRGSDVRLLKGVGYKLNHKGGLMPVKLLHGMGYPSIYASLVAFSICDYFKINMIKAVEAVKDFYPPRGRMIRLEGIKRTSIIDDTYNSAPDSVIAALKTLNEIEAKRKIVVLGDMLELGDEEEKAHRQIGKALADLGINHLVIVGGRSKFTAEEYGNLSKNEERIEWFDNPMGAGKFLQSLLKEGDLILVKGSQGMRMEKVVEEIMAKPNKKSELLVRQDDFWLKKPFEKV